MRRQRLAYTVAAVQVTITGILTYWADRFDWLEGESKRLPPRFYKLHLAVVDFRQFWRAVNAPTFPLNNSGMQKFMILGFSIPELLYLAAVAWLWYWIVRSFWRAEAYRSATLEGAKSLFLLVWGAVLLFLAVAQAFAAFPWTFAFGRIFNPFTFVTAVVYAVWSGIIITRGVSKIRVLLRKRNYAGVPYPS